MSVSITIHVISQATVSAVNGTSPQPTVGGYYTQILGTNFAPLSAVDVNVNGTYLPFNNITYVNLTEIHAYTPSVPAGTYPVCVYNLVGTWGCGGSIQFVQPATPTNTPTPTATATPGPSPTATAPPTDTPSPIPTIADACPLFDLGETLPVSATESTAGVSNAMGGASCGDGGASSADVTYQWTAPADGTYAISTLGSAFNTIVSVLDGSCTGTELACNDDGYNTLQSQLLVTLAASQTVVIVIDGSGGEAGDYHLSITQAGDCCTANPSPACAAAECAACVCASDSYCCGVEWDGVEYSGSGTEWNIRGQPLKLELLTGRRQYVAISAGGVSRGRLPRHGAGQ